MTVAFENYQDDIERYARTFASRYGITIDEARSEGFMAYMRALEKHDPRRASFRTCLINYMRWQILNWIARRGSTRTCREVPADWDQSHPIWQDEDVWSEISQDACDVIALALHPPVVVWDDCLAHGGSKRNLRAALRRHLLGHGWPRERVNAAFDEIREALAEL